MAGKATSEKESEPPSDSGNALFLVAIGLLRLLSEASNAEQRAENANDETKREASRRVELLLKIGDHVFKATEGVANSGAESRTTTELAMALVYAVQFIDGISPHDLATLTRRHAAQRTAAQAKRAKARGLRHKWARPVIEIHRKQPFLSAQAVRNVLLKTGENPPSRAQIGKWMKEFGERKEDSSVRTVRAKSRA
jgi:hypothetical protein